MLEDILVVTASDERQAGQFRRQLRDREVLGLLGGVTRWMVVPDPEGVRAGSGGSTLCVLDAVVGPDGAAEALSGKRLLIIHAGGESRRMPAYAVCGKLFAPAPGGPVSALPYALFDAQLPTYLALPPNPAGQVLVFSGDVLLRFDPSLPDLSRRGLTGVGSRQPAAAATGHGVYAAVAEDGAVGRFLQKPELDALQQAGALDELGRAAVDTGIMAFTPDVAQRLLDLYRDSAGLSTTPLDFYTEFACALGTDTTFEDYAEAVGRHGASGLAGEELRPVWEALRGLPFYCSPLERCDFFHFGTTEDYLHSVTRMSYENAETPARRRAEPAVFGCGFGPGQVSGAEAAVEACSGSGRLELAGGNLVVGALIEGSVALNAGVCLDVLPGRTPEGEECFFLRLYAARDLFKGSAEAATFLNKPLREWLRERSIPEEEVWPHVSEHERSSWNARLFPAAPTRGETGLVLWMQDDDPPRAQVEAWLAAPRYSMGEMADLTDAERFWAGRQRAHCRRMLDGLPGSLDHPAELSADDLAFAISLVPDAAPSADEIESALPSVGAPLKRARLMHTFGSALEGTPAAPRGRGLKDAAFGVLRNALEASAKPTAERPRRATKEDQIVWARCPVRLDLAGGWTDTPPYSLEHGGEVVNVAVNLNGQPPIQAFARACGDLHVRLSSIDLGVSETATDLDQLLDYRSPAARFSVPKAALALCGFSPEFHDWPEGTSLQDMLRGFGGGIELTLLSAVPKGSGLGTSSILGAVVMAALARLTGTEFSPTELFHRVLVLEQVLTTGGGWQDQIGGVVGGLKRISTRPGLVPEPDIHWMSHDLLRPAEDGGTALLFYTGITRLAKDILQSVVGRYLDRNRTSLRVLSELRQVAARVEAAAQRRDLASFGSGIGRAWELNKTLDPGSTTPEVDALMDRVAPRALGAKLLGAGGGGFLLAVCRDTASALELKADLEADPPNELARFYSLGVSETGLEVSVS